MTHHDDLTPDPPEDIVLLAERLQDRRPVPSPAFRGDLRRRLLAKGAGRPRPAHLRALIAGCAASGAALLTIGALVS
jgi:hypothetical protein